MNRYRILRRLGCGPFTAASVALLNWAHGHPANEIHMAHIVLEIEE